VTGTPTSSGPDRHAIAWSLLSVRDRARASAAGWTVEHLARLEQTARLNFPADQQTMQADEIVRRLTWATRTLLHDYRHPPEVVLGWYRIIRLGRKSDSGHRSEYPSTGEMEQWTEHAGSWAPYLWWIDVTPADIRANPTADRVAVLAGLQGMPIPDAVRAIDLTAVIHART
jgi:hypothetical protein